MNPFALQGQVVLITGASRGIGWAIAQTAAAAGAVVVLNSRDPEGLAQRQRTIQELGGQAEVAPFDVTDSGAAEQEIQKLVARHGRLDALVNNAGIQHRQPFEEFPLEMLDRVLHTNLRSVMLLSQLAIRQMLFQGSGRIVNIASIMGDLARNSISAYTTSKGGVAAFTRALAVEYGSRGITCNAIAPGYIHTEMNEALTQDAAFTAFVEKRTPAARWGAPEEVAQATLFLLSPAASYVNGTLLHVDGGLHVQV